MSSIKNYSLQNGEKRYQFQIYVGVDPLTGKEQRTTRRGFKTKKEAQLALSRLQLEIEKGTFRKRIAETYTDVYELWIEQYKNTVEESTFVKTIGIFKNHILPALGEYKIEKINVDACQKHVNEWFSKLKKYRAVRSYASKVLDFALKRGYIRNNPMKLVEMPTAINIPINEQESENFYTKEQLIQFLKCLANEKNFKAYTLFRLLSFSGIRKGEALALQWGDLNFKSNEIRINKALSRGEDNRLYVKSTKNKVSRTIKMDTISMDILLDWKKRQKLDYLPLGYNTLRPKQLVFSNESNEYMQPTKTRKWMLYIQEKFGLEKITTHGLRHTHCSLLFEAGASIKEVQERLGHTDVQTTMNIYAHVTDKAKEEAIQKFEKYLNI